MPRRLPQGRPGTSRLQPLSGVAVFVREVPELVSYCRRCRRHHVLTLPDGAAVEDVFRVPTMCPGDDRFVFVSMAGSGAAIRVNRRNLAEFLEKLDRLRKRHLRRAKLAEAREQRAKRVVESEGEGFRWV